MSNYHEILASFYIEPGITNDGAYDENSDTTPAMDIIALVKDSPTEDHFILLGKQGGGSAYYGTIVDKHGTDVAPAIQVEVSTGLDNETPEYHIAQAVFRKFEAGNEDNLRIPLTPNTLEAIPVYSNGQADYELWVNVETSAIV